jgi:hypothetical protein
LKTAGATIRIKTSLKKLSASFVKLPHFYALYRAKTSFSRSFHAMRSLLNFSGFAYIMLSARFAHFFT